MPLGKVWIQFWLYNAPLEKKKKKKNPGVLSLEEIWLFIKTFLGLYLYMGDTVIFNNIYFDCIMLYQK